MKMKTKVFALRLTDKEKERLAIRAKKLGLTLAAYIRFLATLEIQSGIKDKRTKEGEMRKYFLDGEEIEWRALIEEAKKHGYETDGFASTSGATRVLRERGFVVECREEAE